MKKDSSCITLVYSSDDNYAMHMAISMMSVERHTSSEIKFIIFESEISEKNKQFIANNIMSEVEYFPINIDSFNHFPITIDYISATTYFRLKILSFLPEIRRIIYIDVDALVGGDISELWFEELHGKAVGAILDPTVEIFGNDYKKSIGLPAEHYYFNAGIILMDLDKLRCIDFEKRADDYFKDFSMEIKYQDQDILNGSLIGEVCYLNPRYNYMPSHRKIAKPKYSTLCGKYEKNLVKSSFPLVVSHFVEEENLGIITVYMMVFKYIER
ncbi:MAG: glycosyltransferase family 8 protein [Shewanella sp.]